MFDKKAINSYLTLLTFALALVLLTLSLVGNRSAGDTERIAKATRLRTESRIEILEQYVSQALDPDADEHSCLEGLPEDMVIYKYVNDSLKVWSSLTTISATGWCSRGSQT